MIPARTPRRRRLAAFLAVVMATAPLAAVAGPAEDKATARELAKEGIAAEQKGDCATAIDRLERAEALFHAPTHLQYLARCYTKVGRLVDASEAWRKITQETLPPNPPPAFQEALAEAQAELPKLEPRLARLTVKTAESYAELVVEVDGKKWPSAALDVPHVIDPGKHVVRARATGYKTQEQSVELGEGKSDTITITLEAGADAPPIASTTPSTSASAPPTASMPPASTAKDTGTSPLRTVGLITAGAGAVMLVGGVITGLTARSKFNDLDRACPVRSSCALPDLSARQDSIRTLETTTNVLLIGGGVLAAAGLGLFLFAPAPKDGKQVSLGFSPLLGGGHVALTGSF